MLDDGHPADLARQRELCCVLCAIGVDVKKLIRDLRQRPDRALLIKERRAHVYEMQAKAGRPLSRVLITGFERYANRLKDLDAQYGTQTAIQVAGARCLFGYTKRLYLPSDSVVAPAENWRQFDHFRHPIASRR